MSYSRFGEGITEDHRTARHECGHTLVALWTQIPLAHVRVDGPYGETSVNFGLHRTSYDLLAYATQRDTPALWAKVRSIAQVVLAGAIAEESLLVDEDARKLAAWKHAWQEAATKKPIGSWNFLVTEAEQQVRHWFAAPRVEQLLSCMTTLLLREQWVSGERFAQVVQTHSTRLLIGSPPMVSRPAPARSSAAAPPAPPRPKVRVQTAAERDLELLEVQYDLPRTRPRPPGSTPSTGRPAPARRHGMRFLYPSFRIVA